MADIAPFKATRFSDKLTGDLSKLLTPPYDVITPPMQEDFYASHPRNLVRIDFGKEQSGDVEGNNKYSRSAALWNEWNADGTFATDAKPAIYVYEQEFELPGRGPRKRRGFFSAVKLEDFSEGGIRAHEHTFAGPKADRLNLMRATHTNMSPIFCIYDDPARAAENVIAEATKGKKPVETNTDGIIQRLWIVDDAATVEKVIAAMKPHRLYIADGHHRYETSLNYRREQREKTGKTGGNEPFDYTLMFLANIHDEGLEVLPTHRILSKRTCDGVDVERVLKTLATHCSVSPVNVDTKDATKAAVELSRVLAEAGAKGTSMIMLQPSGKAHLITIPPNADLDAMIPEPNLHRALKALDVTILHRYIVHHVWLGNPAEELDDADVTYVKDAAEAVRLITSGEHGTGFLLNNTRVDQVIEIAGLGMRMPHKSTYFYPKIITGFVIRDMNRQ